MSSHVCPSHHLFTRFPTEDHKCENGITSKCILDEINTIIIQNMQINQWKNTPEFWNDSATYSTKKTSISYVLMYGRSIPQSLKKLTAKALNQYLQNHQHWWKRSHFFSPSNLYCFQWLPQGEKIFHKPIRCNNGIPWQHCNIWTGGLLFIVLHNQKVWQQYQPIRRQWFDSF